MDKTGKKAQFSNTMAFIPVLLVVIVLMALFVFASYWMSGSKMKNEPANFANMGLGSDSIILRDIGRNGNSFLVAEELIRAYEAGRLSDEFISNLSDFVKSDPTFTNSKSCLYIGIGEVKYEKSDYYLAGSNEISIDKDENGKLKVYIDEKGRMTSYQDKDGDVILYQNERGGRAGINPSILDKISEVNIMADNNDLWISGYYGVCL